MTFHIISDILKLKPETTEKGFLVLHLDNCQEQCKCKFTFCEMKKLAADLGYMGSPGMVVD